MRSLVLVLAIPFVPLAPFVFSTAAAAQTAPPAPSHCGGDEQVLFSCLLKNGKTVSICASENLSPASGYMQYRFGKIGRIELALPRAKKGLPKFKLVTGSNGLMKWNSLIISSGPINYQISSGRKLAEKNENGILVFDYDSLDVEDSLAPARVKDLFMENCATPVAPVDAAAISALTGKKVEVEKK